MLYRIKEKFWSWKDEFSILDGDSSPRFFVEGKAFSWGDKLSFQDANRNEVAFINQELFSWKPRYQIIQNGRVFAEVVKEWTWFKKKFTLDIPGPNDYSIEGSFWQHEFIFTRGDRQVARVSAKLWDWSHEYGVEIVDGEDDALILCTCIVIDQTLHNEQQNF
jgi:uncharacterized protein YxjI